MARREARRALVLQGGGALGAYELGVARVLYRDSAHRPDLIAGVSIGAITAALLARPKNGDPLGALEEFWRRVALPADFLLPAFRPYASLFGDPAFFQPRLDLFAFPFWTSLYDTEPLCATLTDLVDLDALADRSVRPHLLLTATEIEAGQIRAFDSAVDSLTLDHIVASGSLPPNFPMTVIGDTAYWDGGLFDNTPFGAVIERMNPAPGVKDEREIIVVNLFPNRGDVPATMADVGQRILNLLFANKTRSDVKLLKRFNGVAALLELIESDDRWKDLRATEAYADANRGYITVPNIIEITRGKPADGHSSGDFSPATIAELVRQGADDARAALALKDEDARPDESRAFG